MLWDRTFEWKTRAFFTLNLKKVRSCFALGPWAGSKTHGSTFALAVWLDFSIYIDTRVKP